MMYKHECESGYFWDSERHPIDSMSEKIGRVMCVQAHYELTLTKSERAAIDWIGDRYHTGDDFFNILINCDIKEINEITNPEEWEDRWSNYKDYTFLIPESSAWEINDLFEKEDLRFPCFSPAYKEKLLNFYDSII